MSQGVIKSGSSGNVANVDNKNRLNIVGQADSARVVGTKEGRTFFLHSGRKTLTSDGKSAILYVKNTSSKDLVLDTVDIVTGSTDGVGDILQYAAFNLTGGTILTNTDVTPVNVNLSKQDSDPFEGDVKSGGEGITHITSTVPEVEGMVGEDQYFRLQISTVIPRGSSLSWAIQPPAGNTSLNVVVNFWCYYIDET